MNVPLLDVAAQLTPLKSELMKAIEGVVDSGRFIMGPLVEELEEQIARYAGVRYGISMSSGTDALLAALMALDVGAGDIVLSTPYSFFATVGVVARLGATPAFVDIDLDSYNIDPVALENWLEVNKELIPKVKAIIPVHLYGQCADMEHIMKIANRYDIPVIEDGAQAIGSSCPVDGKIKSSGSIGKMGCFSFFPSKNLGAMGDGGMVVTNDEVLAEKLAKLRNHGSAPKYYHSLIGGNFRLDALQAAVLLVKLPHLDTWHEMRRANAVFYDEHLSGIAGLKTPAITWSRENHIYNQYVISVDSRRNELRDFLQGRGVTTEVYYPVSFHEQECFRYLGYNTGDFPKSEHAASHTLALPIYPELTRDMQLYVVEQIKAFFA
ncbi:MAG: DegT/DnrJ/EryC1/StrS family aminotransferase [bacterium]|nr:DegT/DnrJ/EryC1/StrS family aminotransferase [bacterium]